MLQPFPTIKRCLLCLALPALLLGGCEKSAATHKAEVDKYAYSAIDAQWDEKFGLKANYKVDEDKPPRDFKAIQAAVPPDGILTMPHALAIATANNRLYQIEKETLYTKALDLRLIQHVYEPNPVGGSRASYNKGDLTTERDYTGFLGFSQLLGTGGLISANLIMGYADIVTGDVRSGRTRIFNAMIDQPLLRGAGREVAMEQLTQAERDVLHQIRQFNRFRKTLVLDVLTLYYNVLELAGNVQNAKDNYDALTRIYDKTKPLMEAGIVALHELEEIDQERTDAMDQYLLARRDYAQTLDQFKLMIGVPPEIEFRLDPHELSAIRTFDKEELAFTEAEAIETAKSLRLDLANAVDAVADAERKVRVAADDLRAGLNIVGAYNHQRTSGGVTTDPWNADVVLDLPLDRTAEQNDYRLRLVLLEQAKRFREEVEDTVAAEVRDAFGKLTESHERYLLHSTSLPKSEKRLQNTLLLLQYSRANTRDVLRAQGDCYAAREEALDASTDFAIALLRFYRATEVLQVREDGMWQLPPERRAAVEKTEDGLAAVR